MVYTSSQIVDIVKAEVKTADVVLTDTTYGSPPRRWMQGKFYEMFRKSLDDNGLYKWRSYFDCDNFSFNYWQFACKCHAKTMLVRESQSLPTYEGITVGVLFFKQKNKYGHAIAFVISDNGLEFVEPQTGQFIKLTAKEKESSWFAIF